MMITLMNGLDRTLFSPSLLSVMSKGGLEGILDKQVPFSSLNKKSLTTALPALYRALRKERPHVVVSTMAHMNFAVLLLKPFFPNTRFFVREAITPSFFLHKKGLRSFFIKNGYKYLYKKADAILCPSKIILDEFKEILGLSKLNFILLYNPVDTNLISAEIEGIEYNKTIKFVASGRLHAQKGFDRLIDVLKNFRPDHPWSLEILGEGEQHSELETLVNKSGLSKNIRLCGHKDMPWPIYASADCFLLPSRWEGMPNVALESLACGTPVIAMSEAGGIAEIAEMAGNQNVRITHSMDEFLALMSDVTIKQERSSLLPQKFKKEFILQEFQDILLEK